MLPKRIEEIEAAIAKAEEELSDASLYSRNPERFSDLTAQIEKLRAEKDAAEERWLDLAEMVETLSS